MDSRVCLPTAAVASLAVPWDSSSFSSDWSNRILERQRDEEQIEASACTVFMRFLFLAPHMLSRKSQRWECAQLNFEQHIQISWKSNGEQNRDRSFTETVLGFCRKIKSYNAKGFPLSSDMILQFPTVRMLEIGLRTWCSNFTTIQRWMSPRLSFFRDRFCGLREKERVLRGEGEKRKWEAEESVWKT